MILYLHFIYIYISVARELPWICDICQKHFPIQMSLLSHKVEAHKLREKQRKLSQLLNIEHLKQTEIFYSSDSDCEYHVVTRVVRVTKSKTETDGPVVFDGYSNSNSRTDFEQIFCDEINVEQLTHESWKNDNSELTDKRLNDQKSPEDSDEDKLQVPGINAPANESFICDYCGKVYSTKNGLKKHMHRTHLKHELDHLNSGSNQHICSKCNRKMYNETYRRNHERRCSTHLCSYCGKHFKNSTNLKIHIMSHTKERPFACTLCDKAFLIKRSLLDHMNKHKGVKPYKCPYENCDKSFTLRTGVRQHMHSIHLAKRFACSYCQHQFSTKYHLDCHVRTHSGEKPYKCTDCSATFRLPSTYKKVCSIIIFIQASRNSCLLFCSST